MLKNCHQQTTFERVVSCCSWTIPLIARSMMTKTSRTNRLARVFMGASAMDKKAMLWYLNWSSMMRTEISKQLDAQQLNEEHKQSNHEWSHFISFSFFGGVYNVRAQVQVAAYLAQNRMSEYNEKRRKIESDKTWYLRKRSFRPLQ